MRVLHLISSTGYHGAENMAAELVRQLNMLGVKNFIGVFYGQQQSNKDILNAISGSVEEGTVFPCNGKLDVRTIFLLRKYIKENNIEIIHSHKYKTNLYALLASVGMDCKLVSTCHNWLGDSLKMRFYAGLDKKILQRFDAVVSVSNDVTGELKKHVDTGKIHKIDNGVDIKRFKHTVDKDDARKSLHLDGKEVVGFVGRLSAEKGVSFLIDAVHKLAYHGMDVAALIVGDGEYGQALKDQAKSLGISDKVVFTGKRNDTPQLYSAMDVFVLPSLKEAFPMVILEAMSCGTPVVATRVGDIPWIIEDNVSGLLVEPKDLSAISEAVGNILVHKDRAKKIAEVALVKVKNNYSSFLMAQKYIKLYEHVMTLAN